MSKRKIRELKEIKAIKAGYAAEVAACVEGSDTDAKTAHKMPKQRYKPTSEVTF